MSLENPNPVVCNSQDYELSPRALKQRKNQECNKNISDSIDNYEIFDMVKLINDPEHPLTLSQLNIVNPNDIYVQGNYITLYFTPTIPHCSLAQTIGLFLKVKLIRSLPKRFKISIIIKKGTHASEEQVNKQINDKERVAAALENVNVIRLVNKGIADSDLLPELSQLFFGDENNSEKCDQQNKKTGKCQKTRCSIAKDYSITKMQIRTQRYSDHYENLHKAYKASSNGL